MAISDFILPKEEERVRSVGRDIPPPPVPQPQKPSDFIAPEVTQAEAKARRSFTDPLPRNIVSGIAGATASALRSFSEIRLDMSKENPLFAAKLDFMSDSLREFAEETADESTLAQALQGVGSTIASIPAAPFVMFDESFQAAKAGGATDEEARIAATPGLVVNTALEYLSIGKGVRAVKAISKIPNPGLKKATLFAYNLMKSSAWEGATESLQQIVNNLIRNNYDLATDDFDVEGALDGAKQAGILGSLSSLMLVGTGSAVARAAGINATPGDTHGQEQAEVITALVQKASEETAAPTRTPPQSIPGGTVEATGRLFHGTSPDKARRIISSGRFAPTEGARSYDYSQLGFDSVYLTREDRAGQWLISDVDAAGRDRKVAYQTAIEAVIAPGTNLKVIENESDMILLAREVGMGPNEFFNAIFVDEISDPTTPFAAEGIARSRRIISMLEEKGVHGLDIRLPEDAWERAKVVKPHLVPAEQVVVFNPARVIPTREVEIGPEGLIVSAALEPRDFREGTPPTSNVSALAPGRGTTDGIKAALDTISHAPGISEVKDTVKGAVEIAKLGIDLESAPLVQVVEEQGTQIGREVGLLGRRTLDDYKDIRGRWQGPVVSYLKKVAGRTLGQRKLHRELTRIDRSPSGEYGTMRFKKAVEDDGELAKLSPGAQEVVRLYRGLVLMEGQEAEARNMQVFEAGGPRPFRGEPQGRRLANTLTPEAHSILEAGTQDPRYQQWARAIQQDNGLDAPVALRELDMVRDEVINRRAPFEVARRLPKFPTHLFVGGQTIPLVHATPFQAGQAFLNFRAQRLAYATQIGQDPTIAEAFIAQAQNEGGDLSARQMGNLLKSLQGIPLDAPGKWFKVGTPGHEMVRNVRFLTGLRKSGLLTQRAVNNLFETINTVPMSTTERNYLRALYSLTRLPGMDPINKISRDAARSIDILDWNFEPGRARESIVRQANNLGQTVFLGKPVDETNELINAAAGVDFVRDLKTGRAGLEHMMVLEFHRFTPQQVDQLMSGEASTELYQAVINRATETGQSTTSSAAERSRAANSFVWNLFVPFTSYAQKTVNRTMRLGFEWGHNVKRAIENPTATNIKRAGIASKRMGLFIFNSALAGSLQIFTLALVKDGIVGLAGEWEDKKDDVGAWFTDAVHRVLFSGASEVWLRSIEDGRVVPDPEQAFLPVNTGIEIARALSGTGPYEGTEGIDRFTKILERNVIAFRPLQSWAAVMGLGTRDRELEVAIRGHYNFLRKRQGFTRVRQVEPTDPLGTEKETKKFRSAMKGVENAVRKGEEIESLQKRIERAVEVSGDPARVAASLRGRRLFPKVQKDLRGSYADELGDDRLNKILEYDFMLDTWADAIEGK